MTIIKGRVLQNSGVILLARITSGAGTVLVPADVTSIAVKVFNPDDGSLITTLASNATTLYASLQLDARWTADAIGFNLSINVPGSAWPAAGAYQVEAKITPAVGNPFLVVWDVQADETFST